MELLPIFLCRNVLVMFGNFTDCRAEGNKINVHGRNVKIKSQLGNYNFWLIFFLSFFFAALSQAMFLVYRALEGESVPMSLPPPLVPPSKRKKPAGAPAMPLLPSPPSVKDSRSSHTGSKTLPLPPKPAPAPAPTPAAAPVSTASVSPVHAVPKNFLFLLFFLD